MRIKAGDVVTVFARKCAGWVSHITCFPPRSSLTEVYLVNRSKREESQNLTSLRKLD
jgi:hypothetical protein